MDIDDALTASHISTLTDKEVRGEGRGAVKGGADGES
jgi:hypothetical protein